MTKALILAAGQGTRLKPYTDDKPKCLVTLMGRTLLDRQVTTLQSQQIKDIHIVTGYRADQIESLGFDTSYNAQFKTTNMVESLFSAIEFLKDCNEDLIISYGDIIYNPSNLERLLGCNDEVAIMIDKDWYSLWSIRMDNPLEDAETLKLDSKGYIKELGKKPLSYDEIQGQYTGLIKIRADKLADFIGFYTSLDREEQYDGQDFYNMYMTSFLQLLINNSWKIKAATVNGGWLEVDSVSDLETYSSLASNGELKKYCHV
ncbi:NTP transferase domain-containing protein [Vibrio sp. HN007]|uniref:phosphocholine cytidylyltransferase family protein n=1 Tax=Vibrio iocasae TaxID=3098914 RepID=UPI0035D48CAB